MASDWIRARANCTPHDVFNRITRRLTLDVGTYNRLGRRKFLIQSNDTTRVYHAVENINRIPRKSELFIDPDRKQDFVELQRVEDRMAASRNGEWTIELLVQWNEEKLTCDLMINDEVLSDERVSQRLIGDFLFGD